MSNNKRISEVTGKEVSDYVDNEKFTQAISDYVDKQKQRESQGLDREVIPNYIGECILKIVDGLGSRPNFRNYCVDTKTQCLTQRGWLNYNELTIDDLILSYDPISTNLVWSPVNHIHISEYDGLMYYLLSNNIDALVTPHHKFVTSNKLVEVNDLADDDLLVLMGGAEQSHFKVFEDEFVKNVTLSVLSGKIDVKTYERSIQYFNNNCFNLTMSFISHLTVSQRNEVIRLFLGSNDNFRSTNKNLVDSFLSLCTLNGISVHVKHIYNLSLEYICEVHYNRTELYGDVKVISSDLSPTTPSISYNGVVWCPNTNYGNFVCRRNNVVYVTGNTYIDEMKSDAIVASVKAVHKYDASKSKTGAFGFITFCAWRFMVNRIKDEHKQQNIKESMMIDPTMEFYDSMGNEIVIDKENSIDIYYQGKL